jgi:ribosomal-protein-alanine N-acetyltransferase
MGADAIVRQLTSSDFSSLTFLVDHAEYVHRHLDWRTPLDWIGAQPFLALERQHRLLAALACPRDSSPIGWIRLFAFLNWNPPQLDECWGQLFETLRNELEDGTSYTFVGLGLHPWFVNLLRTSGFYHRQDIVVLQWMGEPPPARHLPTEIVIRPMQSSDLPEVVTVDNLAFDSLWQHSLTELELALDQSAYATVATLNGKIVGYQASTGTPFHAHLARLAVNPGMQRLSIGYVMVQDMLHYFSKHDITNITVNTQSDNLSSLSLYQKIGFQRTGDDFPVYICPVN